MALTRVKVRHKEVMDGTLTINNEESYTAVDFTETNDDRVAFRIKPARSISNSSVAIGNVGLYGTIGIQAFDTVNETAQDLRLQPIDGNMLTPSQPAFNVYRSTDPGSISTLANMSWTAARFNVGNHFDLTNNRFVAPTSGTYWFAITNNMGSGQSVGAWRLYKNGSPFIVIAYEDAGTSWRNCSASALVQLNANDYIEAWFRGDPDYGFDWCNFYGRLVG